MKAGLELHQFYLKYPQPTQQVARPTIRLFVGGVKRFIDRDPITLRAHPRIIARGPDPEHRFPTRRFLHVKFHRAERSARLFHKHNIVLSVAVHKI